MHGASAGQPKPAGRVVLWVGQCVGKPRPRKSHGLKYIAIKKRRTMMCKAGSAIAGLAWSARWHLLMPPLCQLNRGPWPCRPRIAIQRAGCAAGCINSERRARPAGSLRLASQGVTPLKNHQPIKGGSFTEKPPTNRGGHLLKKNHKPTKGGTV